MMLLASAAIAADKTKAPLTHGLVGHWTFDDRKGSIARDVSGQDNHGTVKGGARWTQGKIGGALEFDGRDDFVAIPNDSHFDITGSVTVSAWIRVESFTRPWQAIVTKGDRAWRMHRASSRKSVGFACSDLSRRQVGDLLGKKDVADGKWHHVAGVLDGSMISIFVDGLLDASTGSSPNVSVNDYAVFIGANAQAGGRLFHGLVDDVRIYDRALSVGELRALVKAGGVEVPDKTVPVAHKPVPAPVPASLLADGFQRIFDGKSLTGWKALDMSYWSVHDGAITGESSDKHPCVKNQFIVWQGGDVSDFDLHVKFRVRGNSCNSGVQFRSKIRPDGLAVGYQADILSGGAYLGGVCDEIHQRDGKELLTRNGAKTVIDANGNRTATSLGVEAKFNAWPAWNDYHIRAEGQHIILSINGVECAELIDREEGHFDLSGILGLQLKYGKPMTVQFKDIYLKELEGEDHWPQFRGPEGTGHSRANGLPRRWDANSVVWKTPIHDCGFSSPVIWDDQIWMTTAAEEGHQLFAVCVNKNTGKIIHDLHIFDVEKPQRISSENTYASPTPVIESGRVYVHYGTYGTACIDTSSGKILWARRDLNCDHEEGAGPASSLLLFGDTLVFQVDGRDVQYIIALDKKTGKTAWKTDRSVDFADIPVFKRKAYGMPTVFKYEDQQQMVSVGGQGLYSYDPRTGEELWSMRHRGWSIAPRPVYGHGHVFAIIDRDRPELWAIRPDGSGDVTDTHIAWKRRPRMPQRASPLLVGDLLYVIDRDGYLTCLDAKSGEEIWQERLKGRYSASPIHAGNRIYLFNEKGVCTVIRPARKLQILATSSLGEEEALLATPAVTGNAFIIRTEQHLYRIE